MQTIFLAQLKFRRQPASGRGRQKSMSGRQHRERSASALSDVADDAPKKLQKFVKPPYPAQGEILPRHPYLGRLLGALP